MHRQKRHLYYQFSLGIWLESLCRSVTIQNFYPIIVRIFYEGETWTHHHIEFFQIKYHSTNLSSSRRLVSLQTPLQAVQIWGRPCLRQGPSLRCDQSPGGQSSRCGKEKDQVQSPSPNCESTEFMDKIISIDEININLQCSFLRKAPSRSLFLILGDLRVTDVAQKVEGKLHVWKIHLLHESHSQHTFKEIAFLKAKQCEVRPV